LPDPVAVGIDVGGTKIAVGVVHPDGQVDGLTRLPTSGAELEAVARVAARIAEPYAPAAGVGVAICELVDNGGEVRSTVSVPWSTPELAAALGALGTVTVEADVRAAALAEARFGVGAPYTSFVYLTVGTGISHCLVVDGRAYRGAHGFAQLSGSSTLTFRCPHCGEPVRLSVEEVASGAAIARAHGAGSALEDAAETLGSLVALLVNVLDPAAVVVGGGLGLAGGDFWTRVEATARAHVWAESVRALPIVTAGLAEHSAVVGAGLVALQAAERDLARREG